jgi:hypothetical protein
MRKFDYRAPRFPVNLPVRLTLEDETLVGRCREISTDGMKLEMAEALRVDAAGAVQITFRNVSLDLPIRVIRCGEGCDGVQFVYGSDEEKDLVIQLISLLADASHHPGPSLV